MLMMSPRWSFLRLAIPWSVPALGPEFTMPGMPPSSPPSLAIALVAAAQTSISVTPSAIAALAARKPTSPIRAASRTHASSSGDL